MSSLKDKLAGAAAPAAAAPAAEAPAEVVPPARGEGKGKGKTKARDLIVESLANQYQGEKIDLDSYGKYSDKLELVALIGDPSKDDTPKIKGEVHHFPTIVGYRFRAHMDMEVPDFGTTNRFNGDRLMSAANVTEWKQVKSGEEFDLTRVETATLMSKPEFGMIAAGGEVPVRLTLNFGKYDQNDKTDEGLPSVSLSLTNGESLKLALNFINVLEYTPSDNTEDLFSEGTRVLNKEFEGTKFAPRALAVAERTAARGGKRKGGPSTQKIRAAQHSQAWFAALANMATQEK